ncbi:TAF5-like RNA polymerase II factor subunit 5L [Armadillidium nasatum]|uniref:TAF5-like RNA polymerase II factor subunit 5L n=1 Tax=Armadillidium nasatum TaxID=96803 RepID=A0A5N5SYQ3_9CRUS|nr:TAF5-like RNA polymerase II factor subunit 5L [Armadillidium nasatum]
MKDITIKGDKVSSTTNEYLKQRSFEIAESMEYEDFAKEKAVLLPEEEVGLKDIVSPTSPNSITFSTTTSHYTFIDQQYISRHHQVFRVNRDYEQTLKQVWSAAGESTNSPIIQSLKTGKYIVRLSELTLNYFLRYLQTSSNPTLLQIFNNFLEVELSEMTGSQSYAIFRNTDDKNTPDQFSSTNNSSKVPDCSIEELTNVKEIISNVRNMKPSMPSVCVYNVFNAYNGLTCAKVNRDARLLVCGFEDSLIKLWRLSPAPQNIGFSFDLPRKVKTNDRILFCDFMKRDEVEESPIIEKEEEEEETKTLGGRHISGGEFCTLHGHRGPVFDSAFTHCSSYLFSVGDDSAMRLWNLEEQRTVALYQGHHYPVWCLDVSPHSIYIATGSYDETVRLWTTECTYPLRVFIGHTGSVDSVAFHPNCSYIASGSHDRAIRLWQVNDASVARILLQHSSPVKCLKFSPNGKYLASGSESGEAFIWDLVAGKVIFQLGASASEGSSSFPFLQGGDPIASLDWSKDSKILFTATSDGYLRGTYINVTEGNEASEVETVYCGSNSSSYSLINMSLNDHNFLSSVVAVHGERK